MHIRRVSIPLAFLFLVMLSATASAQVALKNEFELIPNSPPPTAAAVGHRVAISGDTAVVSMRKESSGLAVAYVYRLTGGSWSHEGILGVPGGADFDLFGDAIAIDGNTVLVAAPFSDDATYQQGVVRVFERTGGVWTHTATLEAPQDFGNGTHFGTGVAISGNVAVVGDYSNNDAGRLVVFERNGGAWASTAIITTSVPKAQSAFGSGHAMQGNIIVAGSPMLSGTFAGAVHVFEYTLGGTWSQQVKLTPPGSAPGDSFGRSVDIDGNRIVAGAHGKSNGTGAVSVILGAGSNWTSPLWSTLLAKTPASGESFGFSVAISGDYVVVGAPGEGPNGSVTVFDDLSGSGVGTAATAGDAVAGDQFGWSVAIDGARAVVGANQHDAAGSAYAYDVKLNLKFPRYNWVFTPWPYIYIYTGCPLWLLHDTGATIEMDAGRLPLRFSIAEAPRNGRLRFTGPTTLEYVPNRGFTGADTFTVRVTDPAGTVLYKTANVSVVER